MVFLILSVAIISGIISYLFNEKILISVLVAAFVVLQGMFAWFFGNKGRKDTDAPSVRPLWGRRIKTHKFIYKRVMPSASSLIYTGLLAVALVPFSALMCFQVTIK